MHFVIVTFMQKDCRNILNLIPAEKWLILDSYEPDLKGNDSMVYQDFGNDIADALLGVQEIFI